MKTIDLTKILKDNIDNPNNKDLQTLLEKYATPHDILDAMKEACKQTLELAAENAKPEFSVDCVIIRGDIFINKQSILDTIKQVE